SFTTLATTAIHPLSLHDALPIFRLQYVAHRRQSPVTRFEERFTLGERQLVRSYVLAALSHEHEWAIINDEELVEEPLGHPKTLFGPAPQPCAADLAPQAIETLDWPRRMFNVRPVDAATNLQPVAHQRDLSKRNTDLRHSKRSGIHTQ